MTKKGYSKLFGWKIEIFWGNMPGKNLNFGEFAWRNQFFLPESMTPRFQTRLRHTAQVWGYHPRKLLLNYVQIFLFPKSYHFGKWPHIIGYDNVSRDPTTPISKSGRGVVVILPQTPSDSRLWVMS